MQLKYSKHYRHIHRLHKPPAEWVTVYHDRLMHRHRIKAGNGSQAIEQVQTNQKQIGDTCLQWDWTDELANSSLHSQNERSGAR